MDIARQHGFAESAAPRPGGVNLNRALWDGFITRRDYAETLQRCAGCAAPAACALWIATAAMSPVALAGPVPCGNAALLGELRQI